jgi:hypothetical protein
VAPCCVTNTLITPACRSKEFPSLRRSVQLALDCARGIAYLHNHHPLSIIHRCDLTPLPVCSHVGYCCTITDTFSRKENIEEDETKAQRR